jgi:Zn finger protein HypA/HybF involved in hydrogenase expression
VSEETVVCPSCGAARWRIVYDEEADLHRVYCLGCGTRTVLRRWRDLD